MSRAIFAEPMTLDEIAAVGGVSRFHMVRAFATATGLPVMRYVRGRRLTEAARLLAKGAPDILSLALEADYGSHEAFTRAFRDHFGATPEAVRAATCVKDLKLQEPILMDSTMLDTLTAPRFETAKTFSSPAPPSASLATTAPSSRPVAPFPPGGRRHSCAHWPGRISSGLWRLLQRR